MSWQMYLSLLCILCLHDSVRFHICLSSRFIFVKQVIEKRKQVQISDIITKWGVLFVSIFTMYPQSNLFINCTIPLKEMPYFGKLQSLPSGGDDVKITKHLYSFYFLKRVSLFLHSSTLLYFHVPYYELRDQLMEVICSATDVEYRRRALLNLEILFLYQAQTLVQRRAIHIISSNAQILCF